MMHDEAKRIIYDPVSWIHPQRFSLPGKFASAQCRSTLNDILFSHYQLSVGSINFTNSKERFLVSNWSIIPRAAFMAVCQRYRASLSYYGQLAKLDSATRQFAMLNLTGSRDLLRRKMTFNEVWSLACQLVVSFDDSASKVMQERLPLLFPETVTGAGSAINKPESNELLLRMAIQHAKRNQ